MALKLDMSKAYDRVEWSYVEAVLFKIGFDEHIVSLFMECMWSARYKIVHVGREFGDIVPERGLRQGVPLSSYLFLICMEGLSALIKKYENKGLIKGIKVARGAPPVSHLFFADDSYVYCRATRGEASQVMSLLSVFEKVSGQKINVEKSNVFFSQNVQQETKTEILQVTGFMEASASTQYLGLPNCIGRNKSAILGYLKDRVRNRIQSRNGKLLNKSGKEILLKTVSQSIPNYAMSVFLIPMEMCKEMEQMMCNFWWQSSTKKNKCIHWMSWGRMCKSKLFDGMRFRHLHEFNIALLGKQGWRLISHPDSLVARIYKARYYVEGGFLNAKLGINPSFIWRSLLAAQELLKQGLGCRVGNNEMVSIMNDPWLPDVENPYVVTNSEVLQNKKVSSLLCMNNQSWDLDLIRDIFDDRDAEIIMGIPLHVNELDKWYWRREKLGIYSVKSAYTIIQENNPYQDDYGDTGFWRRLWNLKVPPKVKTFIWKAATNCLPTKDLLRTKRVNVSEWCPLCNEAAESILHTLISCSFARACWSHLFVDINVNSQQSYLQWMITEMDGKTVDQRCMSIMLCWAIWKCRNDLVWKQKGMEVSEVVALTKVVLNQWRQAQDKNFDRTWGLLNSEDSDELWTVPMENKIKVNTDAAVFKPPTVMLLHLLPEIIKEKNLVDVAVETDCLVAVQAIRSTKQMLSYFGRLIDQCKELLREQASKCVVLRFVKRSANNLAHTLASSSYSIAEHSWEPDVVYPELIHVLENDLK
ncbi:uncharacterized protein LOC141664498 [Apium graveolens]|uniref:uncharacterized protein LOC141664498 n=1 Tax=Apium graveolens TaxID=4045 RepID=UPI003D7A837F